MADPWSWCRSSVRLWYVVCNKRPPAHAPPVSVNITRVVVAQATDAPALSRYDAISPATPLSTTTSHWPLCSDMKYIPDDILVATATQSRCEDSAPSGLLRFINVSQRWRTLGLPLLCSNISLTTISLEQFRFARVFVPSKYGQFVRSLSLRVGGGRSSMDKHPFPSTSLLKFMDPG